MKAKGVDINEVRERAEEIYRQLESLDITIKRNPENIMKWEKEGEGILMPENKDVCLGLMTWPEIANRLKETDIALIPVGQIEQHGLHACIDLDSRNAEGIAIRAALSAFKSSKPVVAPAICYGYSDLPGLRDYPGVFSLRGETLINLYYDVAFSLIRMGFIKVIFVNGHDANPPFIKEAMRLHKEDRSLLCYGAHLGNEQQCSRKSFGKASDACRLRACLPYRNLNRHGIRYGGQRRADGRALLRQK